MKIDTGPSIPPDPSAGYERSDMSMRAITKFAIYFAVFIGISHVLMFILIYALDEKVQAPTTPLSPLAINATPPIIGPQLEILPAANWDAMRESQAKFLGEYGWVNPQAGVVRIPIDEAIRRVAAGGLPVRANPTSAPAAH